MLVTKERLERLKMNFHLQGSALGSGAASVAVEVEGATKRPACAENGGGDGELEAGDEEGAEG